jgi:hypothetical protein
MVCGRDCGRQTEEEAVHPTIQAALAAQHVKDMLAQAAEDGRAREAHQGRQARLSRAQRHFRRTGLIPPPRQPSE